jgi:hypothetical protein
MFEIGDLVREGVHLGTVTDVGTVLVQVMTTEGAPRVVCPWEIVRIEAADVSGHSSRALT